LTTRAASRAISIDPVERYSFTVVAFTNTAASTPAAMIARTIQRCRISI